MKRKPLNHRASGQSLMELSGSLLVFIPLVYSLIDVLSLVYFASVADSAARNAARIAATCDSKLEARLQAERLLKESLFPGLSEEVNLSWFRYDELAGTVSVIVSLKSKLPAPVAGWNSAVLQGRAVLPITSFLSSKEK